MKKILSLLLIGVFIASCSDEDLTRTPNGGLNPENFWKSDKDVWNAINNIYASLPESEWEISKDCGTDNATSHHHDWDARPWGFMLRNEVNPGSEGLAGPYEFKTVRAMNYVLENLAELGTEIINDDLKKRYTAEVRAIRAWKYLQLTMLFGDVPLITKVLSPEEANVSRTPKEEVRTFVLQELTEAASILPKSYDGGTYNERGRITKGTALTLKARAALYFGDYEQAESAAKDVMDLGLYSLHRVDALTEAQQLEIDLLSQYVDFDNLPGGITKEQFAKGIFSYRSIWYEDNAILSNPEYIMTIQFVPGSQDYFSYMPHWIIPKVLFKGGFGWASFCPTQKLVNAYWMADGETRVTPKSYEQRAADFKALKEQTDSPNDVEGADAEATLYQTNIVNNDAFMSEFSSRDARFYATIGFPFSPSSEMKEFGKDDNNTYEWDRGFDGRGITGYYFRKLWDPALEKEPKWNYYGSFQGDFPLLRYAEVLLTFAEARTHNVGYDGQVTAALNEIRNRAGMPDVPTGLSGKAALDFIHNERRIELAGEGHRFFDIRRYEEEDATYLDAASVVQNEDVYDCNNKNVLKMRWEPKLMYLPIPQQAIDFNENLKQNKDY